MKASNIMLANSHIAETADALQHAHTDAIESGDHFAEIVLLDVLKAARDLQQRIDRVLLAAQSSKKPAQPELHDEVIKILAESGITAFWEFPGYVRVNLNDNDYVAVGEEGKAWTAQIVTDHGGKFDTAGVEDAPPNPTSVDIANLVEDAVNNWKANNVPWPDNAIQRIADDFDTRLKTALGDVDYAQALQDNATETKDGICHSHDHCDANMVMADAFEHVMKRKPVVSNQRDADLWNVSWDKWKADRKKGGAA
jgi:hypothetical protein